MSASAVLVLTAGVVADATGGQVRAGEPGRVFATVSTDTRALERAGVRDGVLFIALRGPRFDGHDFAPSLDGVAGVIVDREVVAPAGVTVIRVDDTLAALQRLARAVRRASGARVVAITGSAGKTTTKELTAALLGVRYRVFRNAGNLNNHIGLPLSLLELRHGWDMAVVELGMNHAGEIDQLVGIAEPDVRLWTNVGDAHIGHFGSREKIADAKAEILHGASADTVLVANADDALIAARLGGFPGRVIRFGESSSADVRATRVDDRGFEGTRATVSTPAGTVDVTLPLPGRPNLLNALAAMAVAADAGVGLDAQRAALAGFTNVARRGELTVAPSGVRVVDDSYNASPAALERALESLAATPAARRVAAIGEMRELGELADTLHAASGAAVARAGIDGLVAVGGPAVDALVDGAVRAGLAPARIHRFADSVAAADAIGALVSAGDLVLVKGSRGTRMDIVADRLKGRA